MRKRLYLGVGAVALTLAFFIAPLRSNAVARASMGPSQRLLGPLASVAASVEWVRFNSALQRGDEERAYGHARRALELDARSTFGWESLAMHYFFVRGSALETPLEADRRRWFDAGFDVLREGEAKSRRPEVIAFVTGLFALHFANLDPAVHPLTGANDALREEAKQAFLRAQAGGHPSADRMLGVMQEPR